MRRKDREMGKDFALEIVDSSLFGTAAIKDESSKKRGVYRGIITFKRLAILSTHTELQKEAKLGFLRMGL